LLIVVFPVFISRKVFRRELLIGIAVAVVFGCAAFVYGLRTVESMMTFWPSRMSTAEMKSTPDGAETVWFNSADGTRLNGFYFESQSKPAVATIVFFHGNGGNITSVSWLAQLTRVKSPILIVHGDPDQTIPTGESHLLFASANEPRKLLIVPGAGHAVFSNAGEQYFNQVEQFMREALRAR